MKLKNGLSFENSIKLPKISLEFAGIDIYPRQNNPGVIGFIRTWLFYFNLIWLYPDVIGEVYRVIDGFQSGKTFDELSMSAPCAAICMLSTAKTFPLYFNRDALQKVVEKLTILHPDQESIKEDVKRRILEEAAKILKKIIFIFFNLFAAVGITFCISPCVAMMYNYYTTGTTDFMFPFRIKYFFDPNTSVRWPFVYLHQFWSTIIVIMNIFGSDTLLYAFCTYLRMHFRLLCHRYEDIVSESMTETRENFIEAVKLHQELIRSLRYSKVSLQLSGVDISPKKVNRGFVNFIKPWVFYFNLIWLYPDVVGEFYWTYLGFQMGKSFVELSIGVPCAIIVLVSTAKIVPLYLNLDKLLNVIDKFREIHPTVVEEAEDIESEIVKKAAKFLNKFVVFMFYAYGALMVQFTTSPLFSMLYDYCSTGTTELKYPFPITYFFIDSFVVSRFPFIYGQQVWASFIACFNMHGPDILFYTLCTHLQMHFRLLCHRFENVVSETIMEETRANFRKAIVRHQELIELVNQIEMLYTKSNLWNILSSSLLICLSGFNITFIDDKVVVLSFATFLILSLSQIFLLCFFGDILSTSSNEVYQAVYNCKWYETDQSFKRSVLIVMIRAQTPCKLTAMNFVDLNLPAFTTILSRSWSYFALLKTMFD